MNWGTEQLLIVYINDTFLTTCENTMFIVTDDYTKYDKNGVIVDEKIY
jgi:hypothetical protein